MFLCREKELNTLEKRYAGNSCECVVIYGRRRVGKTALINEFIKNKRTIYFSALRASAEDNLESLSKSIQEYLYQGSIAAPVYHSFEEAFSEITRIAKNNKVVFVIDELPYLCESDDSIPSRLQHLLDHDWECSGLFLILCGSSMSFMEKEILSEQSPLFGRRTAQIKLEPLDYFDAAKFHPECSVEDNALIYGITGGVPHYINKLNVHGLVKDALLENFFDSASYLFEEPENLLRQELREPAFYNSMIAAIAGGTSKFSDIASKLHIPTANCSKYLNTLMELGIVEKVEPIIGKTKNKVYYRIKDHFFRFWYRFVPGNMMAISSGNMDKIYDQAVGGYLHDFMGQTFEYMSREYLLRHFAELPFPLQNIGEWWGSDPKLKKEIQLDIVATGVKAHANASGMNYLIGSCKFKNEEISLDELELIRNYAGNFTTANDSCHYYIFSKGGFTKGLKDLEKSSDVKLVTLEDMYR